MGQKANSKKNKEDGVLVDRFYGAEGGVTLEGSGWPTFPILWLSAISISARGVSGAGIGSGDEAKVFGDDIGGVGESEYIVASKSSSSDSFSSLDIWIGDDEVDDSFLRSLEDFLRPVALGGCLPCFTFILFLEGPSPDGLGSSFTEIVMDKDNSSTSCNNGYYKPIGQISIRARQSIFHMVQDDEGQIWFL
ncbi:uncharacterized protein G2W53_032910 [Senna tora]|uniref:Uncharacterized protein n=1 Tax=Senna tora TaxID=362788 RepID=A0A834T8M5_9FABA|nr:uncharacterized protein G2W53_032910 [Senna tora]